MISARLPTVEAYLARLPDGLSSYPDCRQRGSVFRQFIAALPIAEHASVLPPPLDALVRTPPANSGWVPEAHATGVYLALRDLFMTSDDAFADFCYQSNRQLLTGPIWRLMFLVVSPEALLQGAQARWSKMHVGTELRVELAGPGRVDLRMCFARHLVTPLIARTYATAFRAAIEASGGKDVDLALVESTDTEAAFRGSWR